MVSRNRNLQEIFINDLQVRGANSVHGHCMDLNDIESLEPMIIQASNFMGKIDIVLIAHGTLSDQISCQKSVDLTLHEIKNNALSSIALLTILANRLELQKSGVIAVISSVAGDRGRQSNYVYGSSKALLSTFCSGLRQRLVKSRVRVLTIKPGFIDTPMTSEFKKGILWATPESVADTIVKACQSKNGVIYTPKFWRFILTIITIIPENIFIKMKL